MLRRGVDPLFPANDVSDGHVVIIHHIREMISRHAVALHGTCISIWTRQFLWGLEQIVDDAAPRLRDCASRSSGADATRASSGEGSGSGVVAGPCKL